MIETIKGIVIKHYQPKPPKKLENLGQMFTYVLEFKCGICKKENKHNMFMKNLNTFQVECSGCSAHNKFHLK